MGPFQAKLRSFALSHKRDKAIISSEDGSVKIVDIRARTKPKVVHEFKSEIGPVNAFDWHDSDKVVAMGGDSPALMLYNDED